MKTEDKKIKGCLVSFFESEATMNIIKIGFGSDTSLVPKQLRDIAKILEEKEIAHED